MKFFRILAMLTGVGLITLGVAPVANAHDSDKMTDSSGSISNLVSGYPDVYPTRYVKFGAPTYTYQITFNDSIDNLLSQNCILTLNDIPIKNDTCAAVITKESDPAPTPVSFGGGIDLSADGNYALIVNGKALLSWTFNRSSEFPPNPKPTECAIKSVKSVSVKNKVSSLAILDNGKCADGYWYYTYSGDPKKKEYAISNHGKNRYGRARGSSLVMTKGSTITVTFYSSDLFSTTVQKSFTLK